MIIPYNYMSAFLLNGYKPLYPFKPSDETLTFTFENYIKSQLHLDLVPKLYQRDPYLYLKAFKFLGGKDEYVLECKEVLRFFYKDLSQMIVGILRGNPEGDIDISVEVDIRPTNFFEVEKLWLDNTIAELTELLDAGTSSVLGGFGAGIFTMFTASEIRTLVPNRVLALASVLSFYGEESVSPVILEVIS